MFRLVRQNFNVVRREIFKITLTLQKDKLFHLGLSKIRMMSIRSNLLVTQGGDGVTRNLLRRSIIECAQLTHPVSLVSLDDSKLSAYNPLYSPDTS